MHDLLERKTPRLERLGGACIAIKSQLWTHMRAALGMQAWAARGQLNYFSNPTCTSVLLRPLLQGLHLPVREIDRYMASSAARAEEHSAAADEGPFPTAHLAHLWDAGEVWIFGFGSLVHTPGFAYDAREEGWVRGWRRVWWQGSTDHRGTPAAPGRTVTLAADPSAATWGVAYRLAGTREEQTETLAYLEWREKQYDRREQVDVFPAARDSGDGAALQPTVRGALCYIATGSSDANPNYLGPAPLEQIASQIAVSRGPSGANAEYLFKLAEAMRHVAHADEELFLLESHVRAKLGELGEAEGAGDGAIEGELGEAEDAGEAAGAQKKT